MTEPSHTPACAVDDCTDYYRSHHLSTCVDCGAVVCDFHLGITGQCSPCIVAGIDGRRGKKRPGPPVKLTAGVSKRAAALEKARGSRVRPAARRQECP